MMAFLADWGLELLFALISAAVVGYAKYLSAKAKKEVNEYKQLLQEKKEEEQESLIDLKLEPIYEELEELRTYMREARDTEKTHMSLILASYRFRLIQLCKAYIQQKYITQEQYDGLIEFYKVYSGLGGNGQAKQYYDKAITLEIRPE